MQVSYDKLVEKWSPILNEESAGTITDAHRRSVTAAVLENQEHAFREEAAMNGQLIETAGNAAGNGVSSADGGTGAASNWNPVLIALVRRAMPNLMAYDICGVQPMSGPTGLIFAMKSRYKTTKAGVASGAEALFNEAAVGYSGDSSTSAQSGSSGLEGARGTLDLDSSGSIVDSGAALVPGLGDAYSTAEAEALGTSAGESFAEMGFTIEKSTVTAKSRALKAEYTLELAQDLKAIHGLDAETELANILSTEILSEINREVIRTINAQAKIGARQQNVTTKGIFDLSSDADGRWSVEKFKGLLVQIEREANVIAKETRRGKGNVVICSSDVATAFAGVLNGRTKVYIDPYATGDYVTVGYKGTNPYDAGVFYCPYVPLQMVRAVGENDFQPRIGFKTRYGMASNPYVDGTDGLATNRTNQYYRIFRVDNIMA